jgi:hypothetical protein
MAGMPNSKLSGMTGEDIICHTKNEKRYKEKLSKSESFSLYFT